jgi:prepilin-type N-terminal cleavage/methylation domain-containing protein/prepilin-type processing-associated H-X9-DG protein
MHRHGMSLIELLVVLAIISLLVALLLPAIQAAREAARRSMCQQRIRQVALAVLTHAQGRDGRLPAMWRTDRPMPWQNFAWRATVLAELEEVSVADRLHLDLPPLAEENRPAIRVAIGVLQCPSAPQSPRWITAMGTPHDYHEGLNAAACDYSAVFDVAHDEDAAPLAGAWRRPAKGDDNEFMSPGTDVTPDSLGPAQRAIRSSLSAITDGLSKTILLVEQAGKPLRYDAAHISHEVPPTEGPWATAEIGTMYSPGVNRENLSGPYGFHSGANVAFCDGSVQLLPADTEWEVLAALMTRNGDEIIDVDDWR